MKEKQLTRLQMLEKTLGLLNKSKNIWQDNIEISKAVEEILQNLEQIKDLDKDKQGVLETLIAKKGDLVNLLIKHLAPITNILAVIAQDISDKKMFKTVNYSLQEIESFDEVDLLEVSGAILSLADQVGILAISEDEKTMKTKLKLSDLNARNYGLTDDLVTALEKARTGLLDLNAEIKDTILFKKRSEERIKLLLKKSVKLFKQRVDRLMVIYQHSNNEFYRNYLSARNNEEIEVTKPETRTPVKKVTTQSKSAQTKNITAAKGSATKSTRANTVRKTQSNTNTPDSNQTKE